MTTHKYSTLTNDIEPLPNHVLVRDMEQGDTVTKGGIIITDDNGKDRGIRPRWCKVYKVGKNIDWIKPGEYALVSHGRWTFGFHIELENDSFYVQRVDTDEILLAADSMPE